MEGASGSHLRLVLYSGQQFCAHQCRTFSEPLRALALGLMPWLRAAKEREAHFGRLYSIWDGWVREMQARGPPAEEDDSMWACMARVRDPATGAAPVVTYGTVPCCPTFMALTACSNKGGVLLTPRMSGGDMRAGKPLEGDKLQAEVASLIVGGLDTTAQTCSFTL